jgi:penicillin-binding protein 1C
LVEERPKIIYPVNESVIATDPDIPDDHQFIAFQFQPVDRRYEWFLDNKKTGMNSAYFLWKPEHGRHTLSIMDNNSIVVDTIEFTVR